MERIVAVLQPKIDILLQEKDHLVIAIDGKCTSGKTTLAAQLARIYPCNVFHMDDFFLRPEQRTPERYGQIGGNVDYERFYEEVLIPLQSRKAFAYRPFDCGTLSLGDPVQVHPARLNIVEGSYSHHPYFRDPYDLKILLTVEEAVQRQRILQRPGFLQKRFFDEWIPLENRYFDGFQIQAQADIVL